MEDIDAASEIVHRRDAPPPATRAQRTTVEVSRPSEDGKGMVTEKVTREFSAAEPAAGDVGAAAAPIARQDSLQTTKLAKLLEDKADLGEAAGRGTGLPAGDSASLLAKLLKDSDELNLAGLLNVLDGVVDTPERILVMTSNHPERLDPALVRPGRIDRKILLGYIRPEQCVQMLGHYFGEALSDDQADRLRSMLRADTLQITPAMMEQLCAEHETIDAILAALVERCAGPMTAQPRRSTARRCRSYLKHILYR